MAEIFSADLPPKFQARPGTVEEQQRELEDYLEKLSSSIDEMLGRVFNRLDVNDLWKIDGNESQLITADEIDMQSKKIINLTNPVSAQDAATKASSEAAAASVDQTLIEDTDQNTGWEAERTADDNILYAKTAGVDRTIITADGEQTMPTQPAFSVVNAGEQSNIAKDTDVTVIFGTEIFDIGGNFSANTFTAPVTGKYPLNVSIDFRNIDVAASSYRIIIQTSNRDYTHVDIIANDTRRTLVLSVLADMDANDTAIVIVRQADGTGGTVDLSNALQFFSGHLAT